MRKYANLLKPFCRYVALLPQTIDQSENDGFRIINVPVECKMISLSIKIITGFIFTLE